MSDMYDTEEFINYEFDDKCLFCGETNLQWDQNIITEQWRLVYENGNVHECWKKEK